YRNYSVSGHVTASDPVDVTESDDQFGENVKRAFVQLEQQKRRAFPRSQISDLPHAHRCASCGVEPATTLQTIGQGLDAEHRWMGLSCSRKRNARTRGWLDQLLIDAGATAEDRSLWNGMNLPETFNELAGDSDLGLVLADADGV